jgi:CRISPR-associated protein Cas2
MVVLVCYDVSTTDRAGERRLRRVAKVCESHGLRVQYSVFECRLSAAELVMFRQQLLDEVDLARDSLRLYFVSADDQARTEHFGAKKPVDLSGPLIV